jgi:hypothetical protein
MPVQGERFHPLRSLIKDLEKKPMNLLQTNGSGTTHTLRTKLDQIMFDRLPKIFSNRARD